MKIIEVIPNLACAGAERFVVNLCNEIVAKGHEVVLVTLYSLDDATGLNFYLKELSSNVKVVSLGKSLGFDLKMFGRLRKVIKAEHPDIVHSHLRSLPYLVPSMLITRKSRYFHTIHNDAKIEASDLINRLSRKMVIKTGLCHAVTISAESDLSFSRYYGNTVDRTMIPNGSTIAQADTDRAPEIIKAKKQGQIVLVNVARLTAQKNQLALVDALKSMPDVELFIIGYDTEPYADKVKAALPANVHIVGQRDNPRDYMAAADAFILPSIFEGLPITLIECLSVGTLPIVTAVGGIKDVVTDMQNGIVITAPTAEGIAEAINRFKSLSTEHRQTLEQNSLASFADYNISTCADRYLSVFSNSIESNP